jgi:hypothetical protein
MVASKTIVRRMDALPSVLLQQIRRCAVKEVLRFFAGRMSARSEAGLRAWRRAIVSDGERIVKIKYEAPRRDRFFVSPRHNPPPMREIRLTPH